MTVGDRIRKKREELGLSQTELAEKVKIAKQTMYKYETNVITNIPSNKIEEIASCLEVSPGYLMGWEKPSANDAELLADLAFDKELLSCIKKIAAMDKEKREKIFDYVDFIYSK